MLYKYLFYSFSYFIKKYDKLWDVGNTYYVFGAGHIGLMIYASIMNVLFIIEILFLMKILLFLMNMLLKIQSIYLQLLFYLQFFISSIRIDTLRYMRK